MSDDGGTELFDQDPDLEEDFGSIEWPFAARGELDDVPTPAGAACNEISDVLGGASEHSGDYSFGGHAELLPPVPGHFVHGVGPVPVPLWEERARKLIDKCHKSPFGLNMDTKVDERVRRSWQLAPDQVQFKNPQWGAGIRKMAAITERLGYKGVPLQCRLYKLLVYGEGGHFLKHQDTEKEDGMIATLVVQPPSLHQGGDLLVYRDGQVKHRHDFGKAEDTASYLPHYAVHYADAEYSVEEVTQGYRLALVYSICLPPTMRHLERNPNKPMSVALAEAIERMKPGDDCFALLLSHEYTQKSIKGFGAGALKGVDRARFLALKEANASVSAEKKLKLHFVKLHHQVVFYGMFGDIGDWNEVSRVEKTTWYTLEGGRVGQGDNVKVKFNFLNPERATFAQLWEQPFGSSDMHNYLGNEGPTKEATYSRYAIIAWPDAENVKYTMELIDLEVSAKALKDMPSISNEALDNFLNTASEKLARMDAVEQVEKERKDPWYKSQQVRVSVPAGLCEVLCELLEESHDSAQIKLFLSNFFSRLKGKHLVAPWVAVLLEIVDWSDVGESILSTLADGDGHEGLYMALSVVRELEDGVPLQELLKFAVAQAVQLEDKVLCSSSSIEDLWMLALLYADESTTRILANKFKLMSPRLLSHTLRVFLHKNITIPDSKFVVVASIVAGRIEWLRSQIHVLEKPFSWKMPAAEFPDTAEVQAFLRGPDAVRTTEGVINFDTYGAKNYANRYGADWTRNNQVNASFDMVASGKEEGAFVTISKTRDWYEKGQNQLPQLKKELKTLLDRYGTETTKVLQVRRDRVSHS
ncbi:unnamed protein product [Phytophthora fragariaefolia]|uniref:Unnamed protein product n=1 Tax=Phytophthora fragariaefolia TaxID=1490495 RepID=A0A9W6XIM8_9STRA|nr:unnamed protein product [Phytophthora fragariaefolia]